MLKICISENFHLQYLEILPFCQEQKYYRLNLHVLLIYISLK
jgi:hypothetical protein